MSNYQDILDRVEKFVPFASVVMAVAIVANSLAIKSQRNLKLCAYILKLYENNGTASVAFICP